MLIGDLYKARTRREEIASCREEEKRCKSELAELMRQRELQKELEGLQARENAQEERLARLKSEAAGAREELEGLGRIEEKEAQLRRQDKDLDQLVSELSRVLSDLRGSCKVQEMALTDAERSIKRVMALGAEGLCPTCERPLEDQRDLLIKKYENSAAEARVEQEKLAARVAAQEELIEGATRSRSNLARAFDELNAQKSRRSALQADLKSLAIQMHESQTELKEIRTRIEETGNRQLRRRKAGADGIGPGSTWASGYGVRRPFPASGGAARPGDGDGPGAAGVRCSQGEAGAAHPADTGPGLH